MTLRVVLVCLATYRATRLLVADAFPPIKAFRDWVERRAGDESSWAYLVNCPWCVGVYVGAGVTALTALTVGLRDPFLVWAAAAGAAGFVATVEDRLTV